MKIAITADIHLKSDGKYPERLNALKNILDQLLEENIENLIVAGDLFDLESQNYSIFDNLCKEKKYGNIQFFIIRGNHDRNISSKYFTSPNIKVFNEPGFVTFGNLEPGFLFIPYSAKQSMGHFLAKHRHLPEDNWVLVGHGDYLSGIKNINEYEPGVYMPLSRLDIEYYKPAKVFLGHIHKNMQAGKVYYPGSCCSIDINETGKRSFLIVDLNDLKVYEKTIETDYIFFNETMVCMPALNEFESLKAKVARLIKEWGLSSTEILKTRIRLKVKGYTTDIKKLDLTLKDAFSGFTFHDSAGPDLSGVFLFNDPERISIVERVKKSIDILDETMECDQEKKDIVLEQALDIILGQS